ncbi:hypothetical protein JL193_07530 [Polaribacter batillariae]|uniref:Adhesin domain-containing protein n=1 Tax=Polaribacter batillariae TaxID=2808900 RepID=A0ABX7T213_9FLAO|nr:hypothetical protein [Polaribacter batillariae]QTD39088.1 hypothetical protein JL193_07530 [Polaribacter batillariae]
MAVRVLLKLNNLLIKSRKHSIIRIFLCILLFSSVTFSQKKAIKKFQTILKNIEVATAGLDDLVLENSTSEFIEIYLYSENPNKNHIIFEEEYGVVKIRFNIPSFEAEDKIFRKYITKRLNRASAIVKIPKNKNLTIFGENINITSKSYDGNLKIYIENGIVKLNTIKQNVDVKLYAGNVFANAKKINFNIVSNTGKIQIDGIFYKKEYKKIIAYTSKKLRITTIIGNIYID